MFNRLLLACSVSVSALPLAAQQVHFVPVGGSIQSVIDTASPGDVIQLDPAGNYAKFRLDRALTIVGPATIGLTRQTNDLVVALPTAQVAHFVDLTITVDADASLRPVGHVRVESGVARFEGCRIDGVSPRNGAVVVDSASAIFHRCEVLGLGASGALVAHDAHILATDSRFLGSHAALDSPATRGMTLTGSGSLHASAIFARGGDVVFPIVLVPNPAPQLAIDSQVDTWISDSQIRGGNATNLPGSPALAATAARITRCVIAGGIGTPNAPATVGSVTADPLLLGVTSGTSPTTLGASYEATWFADRDGVFVPVFLSDRALRAPIAAPGVIAQPIWMSLSEAVGVLTTSNGGRARMTIRIPQNPALLHATFGLHAYRIDGAPFEVAPALTITIR